MQWNRQVTLALALVCVLQTGCSTTTPTIAHVHVGHAITGAHDTPGNIGYFTLAEQQSEKVVALASRAAQPGQALSTVKGQIAELTRLVNDQKPYSMAEAVAEAASHISYAANSDDASANVKAGATKFNAAIDGIAFRSNLIKLYASDVAVSDSTDEVMALATEINKMARANHNGEDTDGDGTIGSSSREYGIVQLRTELDDLIARENPPYTTVERWYLFNLIRLPNGNWMFRKSNSKSGPGY